jgi:HPt (histidine-containing phosphotransfer) domain-containing protein
MQGLEETLGTLRAAFVASLPGRAARYRAALERLDAAPDAAAAAVEREQLRQVAHQLAGTGTNFGFPQLSGWGRTVEAACLAGVASGDLRDALDRLLTLLTEMQPRPRAVR